MRQVVVLCGPPGAGKSTLARRSGLPIYDRDDPQWSSEQQFTTSLAKLANDPSARAVVIRTGATSSARAKARALVAATHVFMVMAPKDELFSRITVRGRKDKARTIAGVDRWFERYDRNDGVSDFPGWSRIHEPDLGVMSEQW